MTIPASVRQWGHRPAMSVKTKTRRFKLLGEGGTVPGRERQVAGRLIKATVLILPGQTPNLATNPGIHAHFDAATGFTIRKILRWNAGAPGVANRRPA